MLPQLSTLSMSESDDERPTCTCAKSHCLQRYCMCFSAMWFCSENCNCVDCQNTEDNEDEVEQEVDLIRMQKPNAFDPKIVGAQDYMQIHDQSSDVVPGLEQQWHAKGCKCQKSKCSKMYCECFKNKVGCTAKCQCEGCSNSFGIKGDYIELEWGDLGTSGITNEAIPMENPTQHETLMIQTNAGESEERDTLPS